MVRKIILLFDFFFLTIIALLLVSCAERSIKKPSEKPNILFILTDDQKADVLRTVGNSYIHTPHMDKLASKGVMFENAFIMGGNHGAICAPSRAMLMTGLGLNHVYDQLGEISERDWKNAVQGKYRPFDNALDDKLIMPRYFRDNGYITFGTGKWHASRKSFLNGFQKGKAIFFGGMADHFHTPFSDLNNDGTFSKNEKEGFSTDIIAEATIDFLKSYASENNNEPFFAFVSFTAPHDPRSPAPEYIQYYHDKELPGPPNLMPKHPFNFEAGEVVVRRKPMTIRDEQTGTWPRTAGQIRKQLVDYYGLISHIDDRVGNIKAILDSLKLSQNTIIVYTSDNGLALGNHGLLGKQSLYEHSTKIPLIISGPGISENSKSPALVSLIDLFPTLAALSGIDIPPGLDGKDLTILLQGETEPVRDMIFTTYWDFIRGLRDERWKLITYPMVNHIQLFDLNEDPYELRNLADYPDYQDKLEEMIIKMEKAKKEADDHFPMFTEKKWPMEYTLEGFSRKPDVYQPNYIIDRYFPENKKK